MDTVLSVCLAAAFAYVLPAFLTCLRVCLSFNPASNDILDPSCVSVVVISN